MRSNKRRRRPLFGEKRQKHIALRGDSKEFKGPCQRTISENKHSLVKLELSQNLTKSLFLVCTTVLCMSWSCLQEAYRKVRLISPGLIQLRKGFLGGRINGGAYIQGGGGGLIRGIKKKRFERSHSSVNRKRFLICQFLINLWNVLRNLLPLPPLLDPPLYTPRGNRIYSWAECI